MHIGLIGGIGPAATEFYYRNLVKAHRSSGSGSQLDLTICHAQASDLIRNIQAGAIDEQAAIFAVLANRLRAAWPEPGRRSPSLHEYRRFRVCQRRSKKHNLPGWEEDV